MLPLPLPVFAFYAIDKQLSMVIMVFPCGTIKSNIVHQMASIYDNLTAESHTILSGIVSAPRCSKYLLIALHNVRLVDWAFRFAYIDV